MSQEQKEEKKEYIDLIAIGKKILSKKWFFIKVWAVTFLLACLWIFPKPREYSSTTVIVPEVMKANSTSGLASFAKSFGVNIGDMSHGDAYYPELYPNVVSTTDFIVNLLNVKVETKENNDEPAVESTYIEHLTIYSKKNPLTAPFRWCKRVIGELFSGKEQQEVPDITDSRNLSKGAHQIVEQVREHITCSIDKKTSVITINVWDQDAKVAADMADTVSARLQQFITEYRTHKAHNDMEHYLKIRDNAQHEYDSLANMYALYCEQHKNNNHQTYLTQRSSMENKLSSIKSVINTANVQYEEAKARIQEETPAFTIMSKPVVAHKPTKPKRLIFVITMLLIATIGAIVWMFNKEILTQLKNIR